MRTKRSLRLVGNFSNLSGAQGGKRMDAVRLRVVFNGEVMASITCDGSEGGHADYYSVVFVKGFIDNKKIYGVDPVQSFALGWKLINDLTTDMRVGDEDSDTSDSASWRIESF